MTLIPDIFPKLQIPKNVVKQVSKKSPFTGPLDKQHSKGDQTLLKPMSHHIQHFYSSLWSNEDVENLSLWYSKSLKTVS